MSDRSNLYAEGYLALIDAEGGSTEVLDELFRFSRVVEGNDELLQALSDPHLPIERRQQIVEDLLAGKATPLTTSIVSMTVANGRVRELPEVVDRMLERNAAGGDKVVAQVRTAVPLTDDQKNRLADALSRTTGRQVDVVVSIDPTVMGGIITQIGDTVIDGTVRQRLSQLRESF